MGEAHLNFGAHDMYDGFEEEFSQELDESLDPTGPKMLYEQVAAMAIRSGGIAVDVGCGRGHHALRLARRFGLQVTGIDPVAARMRVGRAHVQPADHVCFAIGDAQKLPVANASVDLIWCRDVLCLVDDLDQAYREFHRVLKPGGRALIYQMFATGRLEASEAAFLFPVVGCPASSMRPQNTEAAIERADLRIDKRIILGSEWGQYAHEHATSPDQHLLHAARLMHDPNRYITQFGQRNYDIKLGECFWHVYRMIGNLSGRVYLLSAPS